MNAGSFEDELVSVSSSSKRTDLADAALAVFAVLVVNEEGNPAGKEITTGSDD